MRQLVIAAFHRVFTRPDNTGNAEDYLENIEDIKNIEASAC